MRLIKELPDPFMLEAGRRVASAEDWRRRRREIKDLLLAGQYGTMPGPPEQVQVSVVGTQTLATGATGETVRFEFTPSKDRPEIAFGMDAEVWRPTPERVAKRKGEVAGFAADGLPALIYVGGNRCEGLLDQGYVVICFENSQLEAMEMGNPIVGPARKAYQQLEPDRHSWGSIAVWAWGALRLVDYALALAAVDPRRIAISGHSRNGKTALLAGALDERIALVNPAGSGCAGAGSYLALGEGCEDLAALTSRERWWAWTHPDFERWAGREEELPFDQHFLMGLVAPRPLLRCEGTTDAWANPEGTCVSFVATEPIYDFLGAPQCNGLYFHAGGHDHTEEDFAALRMFADAHFYDIPPDRVFKKLLPSARKCLAAFSWTKPV